MAIPKEKAGPPRELRAIVVDDSPKVANMMRHLLQTISDIEIVGLGSNGLEALNLLEYLGPDIVVMDVRIPMMNGIQVAKDMLQRNAHVFILLTSISDEAFRAAGFTSPRVRFIPKDRLPQELPEVIKRFRDQFFPRRDHSENPPSV